MAAADDLPWPELGNVSRGATRGNQGQKGVLGPPDREGRCVLQLRVQPGVLAVRLNRQASDWYRILDGEVNQALKLTKTFWRKARRRQDYDARADQDHMELHEWLQQLKDKTMSHLELLMQKGDIQGPPYAMPDDIELTFLRKFIERQTAGVEHNPRLRNGGAHVAQQSMQPVGMVGGMRGTSDESPSPEPSDHGAYMDQKNSPRMHAMDTEQQQQSTSALHNCRATLARAQKESQEAFLRYTNCLEVERQARAALVAAEKRHEEYMSAMMARGQAVDAGAQSRHSSVSGDEASPRYDDFRTADHMRSTMPTKQMEWGVDPGQALYQPEAMDTKPRKHSRTWEPHPGQHPMQDPHYATDQYGAACTPDMSGMPPRKRVHHLMPTTFDVLSNAALQSHSMLQS
uniref:Uncharacterized protein n=1 Tax=Mycena chlorophos TaxID=658473 RepID=A0ABQ0L471_MYCCL|nr:predicted protein [Mycena chlorophos]